MIDPIEAVMANYSKAENIRGPEKCPLCGKMTEYSFVLPEYRRTAHGEEACGYVCIAPGCIWLNAGWRVVVGARP